MTAFLKVLRAAEHWQTKSMASHTIAQLIADYHTLADEDAEIIQDFPMENLLCYTSKVLTELMAEGRYDEWAALLVPTDGDLEDWDVAKPSFSDLWQSRDTYVQKDNYDIFLASFSQYWCNAVFSDCWVNHFTQAFSDAKANNGFLAILMAFLKLYADVEDLSEDQEFVEATAKVLRGCCALMLPEPFPYGASPEDVDFATQTRTRAKDPKPSILEAPGIDKRTAKCIQRTLTKDSEWSKHVEQYSKFMGAESTHGERLVSLKKQILEVNKAGHADVVEKKIACLHSAAEALPQMQNALRPRACNPTESMMLDWILEYLKTKKRNGDKQEKDTKLVFAFKTIMDILRVDGVDGVKQEMMEFAIHAQQENSLHDLEQAVLTKLTTLEQVKALSKAFWAAKNVAKPAELLDHMLDASNIVTRFVAELLQQTMQQKASLESVTECLDFLREIKKEPGITGCLSGVNDAGKAWMDDIDSFVHLVDTTVKAEQAIRNLHKYVSESGDTTGGEHLLQSMGCVEVLQLFRQKASDENASCSMWMKLVLTTIDDTLDMDGLKATCTQCHAKKEATLLSNFHALKTIAGGAPDGSEHMWSVVTPLWHTNWERKDGMDVKAELLKFFEATLNKANLGGIELGTQRLQKAVDEYEKNGVALKDYVTVNDRFVKDAKTILRRALITKLECMSFKTFGKTGWHTDKVKRALIRNMTDTVAKCANLGKEYAINPAEVMHPDLYSLVDEATK